MDGDNPRETKRGMLGPWGGHIKTSVTYSKYFELSQSQAARVSKNLSIEVPVKSPSFTAFKLDFQLMACDHML